MARRGVTIAVVAVAVLASGCGSAASVRQASTATTTSEPLPDYASLARFLNATSQPRPGIAPLTEAQVQDIYMRELFVCSMSVPYQARMFPAASAHSRQYLALFRFLCGRAFAERVIAAISGASPQVRAHLLSQLLSLERYR
jgi:hypothetical protein